MEPPRSIGEATQRLPRNMCCAHSCPCAIVKFRLFCLRRLRCLLAIWLVAYWVVHVVVVVDVAVFRFCICFCVNVMINQVQNLAYRLIAHWAGGKPVDACCDTHFVKWSS